MKRFVTGPCTGRGRRIAALVGLCGALLWGGSRVGIQGYQRQEAAPLAVVDTTHLAHTTMLSMHVTRMGAAQAQQMQLLAQIRDELRTLREATVGQVPGGDVGTSTGPGEGIWRDDGWTR